jgi:hypothetical protein
MLDADRPKIVEYYLALLTGVIPGHARARLSLILVGDASPRPLGEKLLERPRLLSLIRSLVPDPVRSHLVPYTTTALERDLAVALGIPMFAAGPRCFALGTKSGCRKLFAGLGISHPRGFEDLRSMEDVTGALVRLRAARPGVTEAMVKLNEGVSGEGNALVDLRNLGVAGPGRGRKSPAGCGRWRSGCPALLSAPTPPSSPGGAASPRSASPAPGCAARACSCRSLPSGTWRCCPPTTRCSAAQRAKLCGVLVSRRFRVRQADQRGCAADR